MNFKSINLASYLIQTVRQFDQFDFFYGWVRFKKRIQQNARRFHQNWLVQISKDEIKKCCV